MKVLFQRPRVARWLGWDGLAPLLPGWQIDWREPDQTAEHLDGADVNCPSGVPVDRGLIEPAASGWSSSMQYGVGVELIDVDAATEHGVWVTRIAADAPPSLRGPGQAS